MGQILKRIVSCHVGLQALYPSVWEPVAIFDQCLDTQAVLGLLDSKQTDASFLSGPLSAVLKGVATSILLLHPGVRIDVVGVTRVSGLKAILSEMSGREPDNTFRFFSYSESIGHWHQDKDEQHYIFTITKSDVLTTEVITNAVDSKVSLGITRRFDPDEVTSRYLQKNTLYKMPFVTDGSTCHNYHRTSLQACSLTGGSARLHFSFRVVPQDDVEEEGTDSESVDDSVIEYNDLEESFLEDDLHPLYF